MGALGRIQQSKVLGKSNLIFISVGQQLPFDRMIRAVDEIFSANLVSKYEIFAQIGNTKYIPENIPYKKFLCESEFNKYIQNASLIISHAGMGNIIKIIDNHKNAILIPRLAKLNEHRNDHQVSTVKIFELNKGLKIAKDEIELKLLINKYLINGLVFEPSPFDSNKEIYTKLSNYIDSFKS